MKTTDKSVNSTTFGKVPHNRILVRPDPVARETSFGLLLPDSAEKPATGTVVVGNTTVKKGDRILFSLFALDEVIIDKVNYAIVSDSGILYIYE